MSGFPTPYTIAVGVPANYTINGTTPGCVYKVRATNLATNKVVDIRDVTTDDRGYAVASFVSLAVGSYRLDAQAVNCGKCCLEPQWVNVVVDCTVNSCGPCNSGGGCSSECSAVWNVMPRTYTENVPTTATYTLGGVPGCRLKLHFYDGDDPVLDNTTGNPLFTYLTNGVPLVVPALNWPLGTANRAYNWRPAPKAEQDACLANCTISPQRIDINVEGGTDYTVSWDINPKFPVINQTTAGYITAQGLPAGCTLKIQAYQADGVTPVTVLGQHVYLNVPASGLSFSTLGATAGASAVWKPVATSGQAACLQSCTISPSAITLTNVASSTAGCALTLQTSACSSGNWNITVDGAVIGESYTVQQSYDAGLTWADLSSPTVATSTLWGIMYEPNTDPNYRRRLRKTSDANCVSPTPTSNPCAGSSSDYYCLNGTCTQATTQPSGSTGPYASLSACQTACTGGSGSAQLSLLDFSPAPPSCSSVTNAFTFTVGSFSSIEIGVVGATTTSVSVTGIPAGMTRVNAAGSILIQGTPTTAGTPTITATSGGCTLTLAGTVVVGCAITWTFSPTTLTSGQTSTMTVTGGPSNCAVKFGLYDSSDNPILYSGNHLTFDVLTNSSGNGTASLGPCTTPGVTRIKPLSAGSQTCAASCTFNIASKDLTCS